MDFTGLFGAYSYGLQYGKKKKKAPKKKLDNWFESCSVDQLKQLCRACKLTVSGTKATLVNRLLQAPNEKVVNYMNERVYWLKECCKKGLLSQSGNKFDLILRLLQVEHGTADASLKRAATELQVTKDPVTGEAVERVVAKKKRKATPSAKTFYSRVEKKIHAADQKKYNSSNYATKTHAPDVASLMCELLQEVAPYVATDPKLALALITAICTSLADNYSYMESRSRLGYMHEGFFGFACKLSEYMFGGANPLAENMSEQEKSDMVEWLLDLSGSLRNYCVENYSKTTLESVAKQLVAFGKEPCEYDVSGVAVTTAVTTSDVAKMPDGPSAKDLADMLADDNALILSVPRVSFD